MPHDHGTDPAIRWLGPYAPEESDMTGFRSKRMVTDRHADPITIDHIIKLRRDIEELRKNVKTMLDTFKVIEEHSVDDTAKLLSKAIRVEEERKWTP
jgi:DNA-binding ferritin-like protein